jgi:hypothetical protein
MINSFASWLNHYVGKPCHQILIIWETKEAIKRSFLIDLKRKNKLLWFIHDAT